MSVLTTRVVFFFCNISYDIPSVFVLCDGLHLVNGRFLFIFDAQTYAV